MSQNRWQVPLLASWLLATAFTGQGALAADNCLPMETHLNDEGPWADDHDFGDPLSDNLPALTKGGEARSSTLLGDGEIEGLVIRTVDAHEDASLLDFVEWGWKRAKGQSNVTFFKAISVDGTFFSINVVHKPYQAYTMGIRAVQVSPFASNWELFIDGSYWDYYQHGFHSGLFGTLSERFNTCDDSHSKWSLLKYRDSNGSLVGWREMQPGSNTDPGYDCSKGGSDITHWNIESSQLENPCVPDLDPIPPLAP